jgi:UDPglucose 6-dehydrogenase
VVRGHDPEAQETFAKAYAPPSDAMSYHAHEYEALDGADALVLMTEWRHFRNPDFEDMKRRMKGNLIVDTRSIWTMFKLADQGFAYRAIGTR